MNENKTIQGVTSVYHSSKTKDFKDIDNYPISWELIFLNDDVGKEFSINVVKSFAELPKEQGYLLELQGEHSDLARSLNCVFKTKDAFRKILNETLKDISIFDEQAKEIVPKIKLLGDSTKVLSSKMAMAI